MYTLRRRVATHIHVYAVPINMMCVYCIHAYVVCMYTVYIRRLHASILIFPFLYLYVTYTYTTSLLSCVWRVCRGILSRLCLPLTVMSYPSNSYVMPSHSYVL